MDYRILGHLEVHDEGRSVEIGAGKLRIVLASLLLRSNRTVTIDELVDVLWVGPAPDNARAVVQKYVLRVRRLLAGDTIETDPGGGYRLVITDHQLDLRRFHALVTEANAASEARDMAAESELLHRALGLWGNVQALLANVPSDVLNQREVPQLVELYLGALERRIELDLRLDRHRELSAELMMLVKQYPLRERFWAQWIRALHGSGRTGDALSAHQEVATLLLEELGVGPGKELRELHEAILRGDSEPAHQKPAESSPTVPHQLPMASSGFVGRRGQKDEIATVLASATGHGLAPVVVVNGPAGVGKTTLAVHAAHDIEANFPDGQLYCDLRAYAPGPSLSTEEVLGQFMHGLGYPTEMIPITRPDQTVTYRSLLAGKRVLVVLDNVGNEEQVRALLPGSAGSAVIVTSRNELTGLMVVPGAHRITLDVLSQHESHELLGQALGAQRLTGEEEALRALVELCGGLALALRLAAAHLALRPRLSVADYVERLRTHGELPALRVEGDERSDLSSAFGWSYSSLSPSQQRLLRMMSQIAETEFSVRAACAVMEAEENEMAAQLDELAAASLITRSERQRRYRIHDLIRRYASQQCLLNESDVERRRARERLLDYYIAATDLAVQPVTTVSGLSRSPGRPGVLLEPAPTLEDLDDDRLEMIAAARAAAVDGPHEKACHLADALRGYFMLRGYTVDWLAAVEAGLLGARRIDYREGVAAMLNSRGALRYHTGDTTLAKEDLNTAIALYEELGASDANAARINLGIIAQVSGDLEESIAHQEAAVHGYRRAGEASLENRARENLVLALIASGDLGRAQAECVAFEDNADGTSSPLTLGVIATLARHTGDLRHAASQLSTVAEAAASKGNRRLEVGILDELANCHLEMGSLDEAHRIVTENIADAKRNDPCNLPNVQTTLAKIFGAQGDVDRSRRQFEYALKVATQMQNADMQCDALTSLADLELSVGDTGRAMPRVTQAGELAQESGRRLRLVQAHAVLSACYRANQMMSRARDVASEALHGARDCAYPLGEARALEELAEIDLQTGDASHAKQSLRHAESIFAAIGSARLTHVRTRLAELESGPHVG